MPKIRKQRHIQDYYKTLYRIERNRDISTVSSETDVAAFPESPACGIARPPSLPSLSSFLEEDDAAEARLSPAIGSSSGFSDGVNGSALSPSFFSSSLHSRSEETEAESIVSRP